MPARVRKPYRGISGLPELEGWITFGEAARDLGVTDEGVRQMAVEGKLKTAHRLGRRPIGVVREEEVAALAEERQRSQESSASLSLGRLNA